MKSGVIAGLVVLALVVVGAVFYFSSSSNPYSNSGVCAQDAKQCPDGSYVSRVAPDCDFADCPAVTGNQTNNTFQGEGNDIIYTIEINGFAFSPTTLTVNVGDTIMWTNEDSAPHTVTSDSGSELASQSLSRNGAYTRTFTTAGTFDYHCAFHSGMKGKIIVK
jgi:plastocyanin